MDMVIVTCAAPEDAPATTSSTTKARRASIIAAIGAACPVSETGRMSGATLTLAGDAAEKVGAWKGIYWRGNASINDRVPVWDNDRVPVLRAQIRPQFCRPISHRQRLLKVIGFHFSGCGRLVKLVIAPTLIMSWVGC